jgi:hypothetical protein
MRSVKLRPFSGTPSIFLVSRVLAQLGAGGFGGQGVGGHFHGEGTSRFSNFSTGADCASTLACMTALGASVSKSADGVIEVTGVGGKVTPANHPLDCGNSGSTMRMIAGLLAPQQGSFTLIGDASLSRRPMERIRKPLAAMGAKLTLTEGHAPLSITAEHRSRPSTTPRPSPAPRSKPASCWPACRPPASPPYARLSAPATTANWPCAPLEPN